MEVKLTPNRVFWFAYFLFCVFSTTLAQLLGVIDVPMMSRAEHIIFISSLILSGMVMRHWFKVNYKDMARKDQ